jgi:branched-chain amino acid aminotransferase
VAAGPFEPWPASSAICTVPWPWNERSPLAGVKATSHAEHVLAQAHARAQGCDEAVFANTAGQLCEGAGSNVFVVVAGQLLTPSLASGCLAGVTRALVLEVSDAEEADAGELPIEVLRAADEIFLTSSTRDVQPVRRADGRDLGPTGPLTLAAAKAFSDLASTDLDP